MNSEYQSNVTFAPRLLMGSGGTFLWLWFRLSRSACGTLRIPNSALADACDMIRGSKNRFLGKPCQSAASLHELSY